MNDYPHFLIFGILTLGSALALWAGYVMRNRRGWGQFFLTGVLTIILAVVLIPVIGLSWEACGWCTQPKDTTTWLMVLLPVLQAPLNWCLMLVWWFRKREVASS